MGMSSLNVGIIGMGKMGILHAGILAALDGVKVKAVAEKLLYLVKDNIMSCSGSHR
jgi:predicted homoserine dehydrogenase-like protein